MKMVLGGIILAVIVTLIEMMTNGIVLMVGWNWFLPHLFGLPSLSLPGAMFLGLLVSFVTRPYVPIPDEYVVAGILMEIVFRPLLALIALSILHLFL